MNANLGLLKLGQPVIIHFFLSGLYLESLQMNFRQYTHYGQHLSVYILQILSWKDQLGKPVYMLCCYFVILLVICLYYIRWALTHPLSAEEIERLKDEQRKPKFLDMVPWYSGTSSDLFKTAFDLLVSVTVFMGRFDMRMMQAAMNGTREGAKQEDFLYDHFRENDDFWFDFMADTGDGGNSSYSVARLLAQPSLDGRTKDSSIKLPRGDLLLIVGDLAYPYPSPDTYEKRFFYPFEEAPRPPSWYKEEHIAINKPELPVGISDLKQYDGPQCFVIPGNHD
ncbi:uncharacterized protein LOC110943731 [Helianthus annuus]|uniref:uncharacterized protein LOC110943731 n=1 Tax=Helianthus annuus TaxID=4232 RepID=UPI001652BE1C|nr:uncharacterized protein LOC110943731 [Helianthus annuus]